jgi:hypothetical protein
MSKWNCLTDWRIAMTMINEEIANNEIDYHEKKPKHDYGCWFMNNNLIVPKLNKQYILKKDLKMAKKWSQCNYPSGMVVKVVEYIPNKECLNLKINTQSIPEDKFPLLHDSLNSLIITFYDGNDYSKKLSQFYDYFEEFDKDMTMADVLDVRQAMDKFYSAVKELNRAIDEMDGDCNYLIADEYPLGLSYDEWVLSFMEWYNSVDNNCNAYRHAIKTVGGTDENQ